MKVKIKKLHPDAVIPKYVKDGDAQIIEYPVHILDLCTKSDKICACEENVNKNR